MHTKTKLQAANGCFSGKKIKIVGMGKTGISCLQFLSQFDCKISVADKKIDKKLAVELHRHLPSNRIEESENRIEWLQDVDILVVSPGVRLDPQFVDAANANGVEMIGDIEIFSRYATTPIIAVTGSNGKSTVVRMLEKMLQHAGLRVEVGGNIGIPALTLLAKKQSDYYLLELSSYQLELTRSLRARAAAILNVSPDHQDRYSTYEDYKAAKNRLLKMTETAVLPIHDTDLLKKCPSDTSLVRFGYSPPENANDFGIRGQPKQEVPWYYRGSDALLPLSRLALKGRHNHLNFLATMALADCVGVPLSRTVLTEAGKYSGLDHRYQLVLNHDEIEWINDSKATNVGAVESALISSPRPTILILGGQAKQADLKPLAQVIGKTKIRGLIVYGEDSPLIIDALQECCEIHQRSNLQDSVALAKVLARPGDRVLFSPACASFDQFRDYQQRGEFYSQFVREVNDARRG